MDFQETGADPYLFPDIPVLRNRLNLRDAAQLDRKERLLVSERSLSDVPTGDFDLKHLRAIHRHLFQDVYDWAGEVRTVEISKGASTFQFRQYIETGMADIHGRLVARRFLTGLDAEDFATHAGQIVGDLNYVHPFREGNGRTQMQYLKQLAEKAGHPIDIALLNRRPGLWVEASISSHEADYAPMARLIGQALTGAR